MSHPRVMSFLPNWFAASNLSICINSIRNGIKVLVECFN
jgi:hypothetical protein